MAISIASHLLGAVDVETDVERGSRLSDRARRDQIRARFGKIVHVLEGHTTGHLDNHQPPLALARPSGHRPLRINPRLSLPVSRECHRQLICDHRSEHIRLCPCDELEPPLTQDWCRGRQRIDMNEVVTGVTHMVQPDTLARSYQLQLSLAKDLPVVEGDPIQIQQVLINLVTNACEAMGDIPVARRKVELTTERNGVETIRVTVRDYGVGISDEARERLFEQFFTTKKEGLGMGLAIVRSIIEAHGGKIEAENVNGGGARFHFTLPAAKKISK